MTWVLAVISLVGNELVIRKLRAGFVLWLISNTGLGIYFWAIGEYALAALYGVYWVMALRGWWKWKKADVEASSLCSASCSQACPDCENLGHGGR
jgi:nicotinamide riboside transporter PnuC